MKLVDWLAGPDDSKRGPLTRWVENIIVLLAGIAASFTIIYVAWHVARWVGR
jgi:hypothetical protein